MPTYSKIDPLKPILNGCAVVYAPQPKSTVGPVIVTGNAQVTDNMDKVQTAMEIHSHGDFPEIASPNDIAVSTANANATVTYAAVANRSHVIDGIFWSYTGGTLTTGRVTVTVGGTTVFDTDITAVGPGYQGFNSGMRSQPNQNMVITLYAGGTAVVGKLVISGHRLE
jgi:hypothetical protein